ncbi:MAG: hypothetical protein E7425_14380 [Ruminococcaceae bacterium]|nr:hypothetical protein [Oscillospiraceae bacterium]
MKFGQRDGKALSWEESTARDECQARYNRMINPIEQAAICLTAFTEEGNEEFYTPISSTGVMVRHIFAPVSITGDRLFLLSAKEVLKYFNDRHDRTEVVGSPGWWLRSQDTFLNKVGIVRGFSKTQEQTSYELYDGHLHSDRAIDNTYLLRPACNLDAARIVMVSPAEGGKTAAAGTIAAIPENTSRDYKLTLLDDSRKDFAVTTTSATASLGGAVSVSYSGAKTGESEHVSVLLCDKNGMPIAYGGSEPLTKASGSVSFTLPTGFAPGSYTLRVFNEQRRGAGQLQRHLSDGQAGNPRHPDLDGPQRRRAGGNILCECVGLQCARRLHPDRCAL